MVSKKKELNYELNINGLVIPYTLVKSSRRRTIAVQIGTGGKMTVRCPYFVSKGMVDGFLREKQNWIYKHYTEAVRKATEAGLADFDNSGFGNSEFGNFGFGTGKHNNGMGNSGTSENNANDTNFHSPIPAKEDPALVNKHKKYARKIFEARVAYFQQFTGGKYTSITIRDQKTRWGSCSGRGTLSFNWRLILAPPEILDYVVVHELCHLTHMNHSKEFWALVGSVIPDYKMKRKWLKENGHTLQL